MWGVHGPTGPPVPTPMNVSIQHTSDNILCGYEPRSMESEGYNTKVETLRSSEEFPQLQGNNVAYLDHAGTTLYSRSQLRAVIENLENTLFGNPHTGGSGSGATTASRINDARQFVLEHFCTTGDDYQVVFTSGSTAALRLAMDCFAAGHIWDGKRGRFAYHADSHTSVVGLREIAAERGFQVECLSMKDLSWSYDVNQVDKIKHRVDNNAKKSLIVISAQCNFTGSKQDLNIIAAAEEGRLSFQQRELCQQECWHVMLDASSFASTSLLNLNKWKPSYVVLSFYKMLGYPTGLGALLVRCGAAEQLLRGRSYFAGGNVQALIPNGKPFDPSAAPRREKLHDMLESGTIPFLEVSALSISLKMFINFVGSMECVEKHVFSLVAYLRRALIALEYEDSGQKLVELYCPSECCDVSRQGGILAFNLRQKDGSAIGYSEIEARANAYNVHVRTGCFCNVGACQRYLGLSNEQLWHNLKSGHVCGDQMALVDGKHTGAVRVSFGYCSTRSDADRLVLMLRECFLSRSSNRFLSSSSLSTQNFIHSFKHQDSSHPRIYRLFLYPIKSCGAQSVTEWPLISGGAGFLWDRMWLVTNESGTALTLKSEPRLVLIRPHIDLVTGTLTLHLHDQQDCPTALCDFVLPLVESSNAPEATQPKVDSVTRVCGDKVSLTDCGDEVARWLVAALRRPGCRLARRLENDGIERRHKLSSLANESHFLLLNLASLKRLQMEMVEHVLSIDELIDRFRANFVVAGGCADEPLIEERWDELFIGENKIHLRNGGVCIRCQMICVDQGSGEITREPMTSLCTLKEGKLRFGIRLNHSGTALSAAKNTSLTVADVNTEQIYLRVDDVVNLTMK